MTYISFEPKIFTADELDTAIPLDSGFIVNDDGTIEDSGNFAPEVRGVNGPEDPEIFVLEPWEFFSRGYTGQHGYSGPEMHQSEFLGGSLARDILITPGEYALCPVIYDCDEDFCGDLWEDGESSCGDIHAESWVVLRRI